MKNIFQHLISKKAMAIFLVVATFASCEKELEDKLLSDTSVEFLYSTPEGLENAVVGLYTLNRNLYQDLTLNRIPSTPHLLILTNNFTIK